MSSSKSIQLPAKRNQPPFSLSICHASLSQACLGGEVYSIISLCFQMVSSPLECSHACRGRAGQGTGSVGPHTNYFSNIHDSWVSSCPQFAGRLSTTRISVLGTAQPANSSSKSYKVTAHPTASLHSPSQAGATPISLLLTGSIQPSKSVPALLCLRSSWRTALIKTITNSNGRNISAPGKAGQ